MAVGSLASSKHTAIKKQTAGLQEASGLSARSKQSRKDLPFSRSWPETTMHKGIEAGEVLRRLLPNTSLASSRPQKAMSNIFRRWNYRYYYGKLFLWAGKNIFPVRAQTFVLERTIMAS